MPVLNGCRRLQYVLLAVQRVVQLHEARVLHHAGRQGGGMQTADKIEAVAKLLGKSGMVGGDQIADVAHGLKYFARAGLKDDYDLDIYKCADWLHRLITGQFLNEVEDESGSGEK